MGRRIHLLIEWREQHVDALALETRAVGVERPRIAIEVLVRTELQPVDEDARDDRVAVLARDAAKLQVAFVQVAHRRHERHAARAVEALRELGCGADNFHTRLVRVWSTLAEIEELAPRPHAGDPREQHFHVRRIVDEIQALAVDDQQRRLVVLVEEARVRIGQPREIPSGIDCSKPTPRARTRRAACLRVLADR